MIPYPVCPECELLREEEVAMVLANALFEFPDEKGNHQERDGGQYWYCDKCSYAITVEEYQGSFDTDGSYE